MTAINILSFILAVFCYGIKELQAHGKLKWGKGMFWGEDSAYNKYKLDPTDYRKPLIPAPNNWYYRFFKIKYKERFPLSATALVFLTDGFHLCQLAFKCLVISSLITYEPIFNLKVWDFILYFLLFGLVFTATYKFLSK